MKERRQPPPNLYGQQPSSKRPTWQGPNFRSAEDLGVAPAEQKRPIATTQPVQPVRFVDGQVTQPREQPRVVEQIRGTQIDAARAFQIRTAQLSTMTALATGAIWFLVRWALPYTTGGATAGVLMVGTFSILAALIAFTLVWAGAYVLDMATSPGGVEFLVAWRTQRRLDDQSAAMVDAYRRANGVDYER